MVWCFFYEYGFPQYSFLSLQIVFILTSHFDFHNFCDTDKNGNFDFHECKVLSGTFGEFLGIHGFLVFPGRFFGIPGDDECSGKMLYKRKRLR